MIVISQEGDFARKIENSVGWREEAENIYDTQSKTIYAVRVDGFRMGYFSTPEQAQAQYEAILDKWLYTECGSYRIPQDFAKKT